MKFDLHIHSKHSIDSNSSFEKIYKAAKSKGLSGIAICDHNVFTKAPECDDLIIIPAAEYSTDVGHILVYFLKEDLGLSHDGKNIYNWREVVDAAHAQGAICFLAHPFAPKKERSQEVWDAVDGIEVYNARIENSYVANANFNAQTTAMFMKKPYSAGSDAHFPGEVGGAFWECECEPTLEAIKSALLAGGGKIFGAFSSPYYRIANQFIKMKRLKTYSLLPKSIIRLLAATLIFFKKRHRGYINMKGNK